MFNFTVISHLIVWTTNSHHNQPLFLSCLQPRDNRQKRMATDVGDYLEVIFVDLLITATIPAGFDSYIWYSLTRMFNTEDGDNTILRIFRNSVTSHKTRTVSTHQQLCRQKLKSANSKGCWLNWEIPVSLFPY